MQPINAAPISAQEAEQAFLAVGLRRGDHVGVGVSGGADSVALALLAHAFLNVTTFTVDHGLRPESTEEAEAVSALLAHYGVANAVLHWDGLKPTSQVQAAAREARYRLMAEACADAGLTRLLVGHHRGDQAETVLMRLVRGVGLKGLSGMRPSRRLGQRGVTLLRPFLDVPKSRLIATLVVRGVDWIEDPSNQDAGYERVRVRRLLSDLDAPDEVEARLAASAAALTRADRAVDHYVRALMKTAVRVQPGEWLRLSADEMYTDAWPEEVRLRLWALLVRLVAGHGQRAPLAAIQRIDRAFADPAARAGASQTLAHVRIVGLADGNICLAGEAGRVAAQTLLPGQTKDCDCGAWRLTVSAKPDLKERKLTVCALGEPGWVQIKDKISRRRSVLSWPHAVKTATPAVFDGETVVAAPALEYKGKNSPVRISGLTGRLAARLDWSFEHDFA